MDKILYHAAKGHPVHSDGSCLWCDSREGIEGMKDYEYTKLCIKRHLDHLEDDFNARLKWLRSFLDNPITCKILNSEKENKMAFGDDTLDPSNVKDYELDKLAVKYNEARKEIQELNFELFRVCQFRDWLMKELQEIVKVARFSRNLLIGNGEILSSNKQFEGNWIAVPEEDFDKLRELVNKMTVK